jgi:hypothetical protein
MKPFDYAASAELYPGKRTKIRQAKYQRFDNAAEALRFANEEMPAELLIGAVLEVDEQRFDGAGIRDLYAAEAYPLSRIATAA